MTKPYVREVIVVEGRYDKNAVSQVVDALIFETGGFSLFHNPERLETLRKLAEERGVIILTDSDGAGFVIRGKLKGMFPGVRNAFVPALSGKEKRKRHPSREGILGVEGLPPETILKALREAGASMEEDGPEEITAADFYAVGLTGKPGSAARRKILAASLGLPAEISQSDLRKYLSGRVTAEELRTLVPQEKP